ncbi:MAG: MobP3 family relaxase [Oscillospiraceae bacterium]|nr:MobP3 family relaxase [Oscillospiraceae bacterium]
MPKLITKFKYIKPGENAGKYAEYVATREGVEKIQTTYADYIAKRPRSSGLFSSEGADLTLAHVSQALNEHPGNIWTCIISLRREDAERLGFNRAVRWRDMMRSQVPELSKALKIPMEHLRWYGAFHNEGHHPHIHLIAYSTDPKEGHLSKQGVEHLRSALAKDIFAQDLISVYERQTQHRDDLRQAGRVRVAEIVDEINRTECNDPELERQLRALSARLSRIGGKKIYGYLKSDVKDMVNAIVDLLGKRPQLQELYELWYQECEAVLRTYTDEMPPRVPLSQNSAFRPLRNAVIQEALRIQPQEETVVEDVPPHVETPPEETSEEAAQNEPAPEPPIPASPSSTTNLLREAVRLFQLRLDAPAQSQRQQTERKLRQKLNEKKVAQGMRIE